MTAVNRKIAAPFGQWKSPIKASDLTQGVRNFGHRQGCNGRIYWTESRPEEKGRQVIMRAAPGGEPEEMLPPPFSARSRVHEYGGAEFTVIGETVYFVNDKDQDIWVLEPGRAPKRLTNEPQMRFSSIIGDAPRSRLIAVGERHAEDADDVGPENLLVAIDLEGHGRGKVHALVQGRDFYAFPALPPSGSRIAFLGWDLPDMPWDQSALYVAAIRKDGSVGRPKRIAGGRGVAAMQPVWLDDERLVFVEDSSGLGNLALWESAEVRRLTSLDTDLGTPMWSLGARSFVVAGADNVVAVASRDGVPVTVTVSDLHRKRPKVEICEIEAAGLSAITALDGGVGATIASDTQPAALGHLEAAIKAPAIIRTSASLAIAPAGISIGREVRFRGGDGKTSFARYYAPASARFRGISRTLPPALVLAHGGPTAAAAKGLGLRIQYYTSRGFAVLDVDYAGSTGYGRAYRQRLDGLWGVADVRDCAAAARWLAKEGLADSGKIAIAGGSAGGYTVLMSLATTDVFAAGSSHYGISDLSLLMEHTHKFEAGYLHRLLGTTARSWRKVGEERSPIHLVGGIEAPVILFQGLEDKVVPPEQSRLIADTLKARGQVVELHEFPGEGHGFRQGSTIEQVAERELAFLIKALRLSE